MRSEKLQMGSRSLDSSYGWWNKLERAWTRLNAGLLRWYELHARGDEAAYLPLVRSKALARDELFSLSPKSRVREVRVQRGVVWVTSTEAPRDILLHAGQGYFVGERDVVVVQALVPAEVDLFQVGNAKAVGTL